MVQAKFTHPTTIVIFGGTGNLAKTKLIPALFDLYLADQLPEKFSVIGFSRKDISDEEYQNFAKTSITDKNPHADKSVVEDFCVRLSYVVGDFTDLKFYEQIKAMLLEVDDSIGQCANKLFYLAVSPKYYETIFDHLHASRALDVCAGTDSWARLLVEKPFGRNLETAQALEAKLCSLFNDEQIYRIDHYLAKNAIENIISLRFVNTVLADSWNNQAIESIHIKLLETKDVYTRGSFYDSMGTLRDVGQNHLLQIFALLTMAPADVDNPQAIRKARAVALKALSTSELKDMVRAQYKGYKNTPGVEDDSDTETYFKLSFTLASELWQGTQFTFEAGKALDEQVNEAVVVFRPQNLCNCGAEDTPHEHRNVLRIQFTPKQHICLSLWTKTHDYTFTLKEETLTLLSQTAEETDSPEAYERVLLDCIVGNQTRFVSDEEVEHAWRFITPILEQFKELPLYEYEPGTSILVDK